jgi:hypothetical protein
MKENQETSCSCFKWGWERVEGEDHGDNVTYVQYKFNQNCHYEYPLYDESILIKMY